MGAGSTQPEAMSSNELRRRRDFIIGLDCVRTLQWTPMIRPVRAADVAAICRVYNHYVLHTIVSFEEEAVPPDEMARRVEAVAAAGLPWLVLEEEDHLIGYAYATPWKARKGYRYAVEKLDLPGGGGRGEGARLPAVRGAPGRAADEAAAHRHRRRRAAERRQRGAAREARIPESRAFSAGWLEARAVGGRRLLAAPAVGRPRNRSGYMSNRPGCLSNRFQCLSNPSGCLSNRPGSTRNRPGCVSNPFGCLSNRLGCMSNRAGCLSNSFGSPGWDLPASQREAESVVVDLAVVARIERRGIAGGVADRDQARVPTGVRL